MTYYDQNALKLCHAFWRERLRPGDTVTFRGEEYAAAYAD